MTKPNIDLHRISTSALLEAIRKVPVSGKPELRVAPKEKLDASEAAS